MTRYFISSGSTVEQGIGCSRAVVAGDWVVVSGTTGLDYSGMAIVGGLSEQAEQCMKQLAPALLQAGQRVSDVVRVTHVLPNGAKLPERSPVPRRDFGEIRLAATMIRAGLADP